jgi:hypothetical protein
MAELSHRTRNGLEDLYAILKARDVMVEQLRLDLNGGDRDNVRIILDGQRDITGFDIPLRGYKDLMHAVGESTNVKYIWMLCDINFSPAFCIQLCRALCVNHTVSALRFELTGNRLRGTQSYFDSILNQVAEMFKSNKGLKYFACKYSATATATFEWSRIFWSLDFEILQGRAR